jgi:protein-disulfide isomerase
LVSSSKSKEQRKKEKLLAQVKKSNRKGIDPFVLWTTIGVILIAIAVAVFAYVQSNASKDKANVEASSVSAPNTINDGYTLKADGAVKAEPYEVGTTFEATPYTSEENNITMYVDYACSHCFEFEEKNNDQMKEWLADGTVDSVSIHPVSFLSEYSIAGANAMSCVAEYAPDKLWEANDYLMTNQATAPSGKNLVRGLAGVTDVDNDAFAPCVIGGKYYDQVDAATARVKSGPIPNSTITTVEGTPTVLVNGEKYPGNPDAKVFAQYVTAAVSGDLNQGNTETVTPEVDPNQTPVEE